MSKIYAFLTRDVKAPDFDFPEEGECSLCGGRYDRYGNNPAPLGDLEARCCTTCNNELVIPVRFYLAVKRHGHER
jgi:hypothetical protein